MTKHVTIIQGHPDANEKHFGHALAGAYAKGVEEENNEVKHINVAELDFPLLCNKEDFETGLPPRSIQQSQDAIAWADHLAIIYPLWLGTMPALLKAFLEQVFRPGFAFSKDDSPKKMPKKLLTGKSARIIITVGMPALVYRWYFRAHGLKTLQRSILAFSGIGPIKASLIGSVEEIDDATRSKWISEVQAMGRKAR